MADACPASLPSTPRPRLNVRYRARSIFHKRAGVREARSSSPPHPAAAALSPRSRALVPPSLAVPRLSAGLSSLLFPSLLAPRGKKAGKERKKKKREPARRACNLRAARAQITGRERARPFIFRASDVSIVKKRRGSTDSARENASPDRTAQFFTLSARRRAASTLRTRLL